jgi:hypothetical protein
MIPTYFAIASAAVLLLHTILLLKPLQKHFARLLPARVSPENALPEEPQVVHSAGFFAEAKDHILKQGGPVVFTYKVARLLGCLAFLGVSLATLLLQENEASRTDGFRILGKWGKKPKKKHGHRLLSKEEWLQFAICTNAVSLLLGRRAIS